MGRYRAVVRAPLRRFAHFARLRLNRFLDRLNCDATATSDFQCLRLYVDTLPVPRRQPKSSLLPPEPISSRAA